MTVVSSAGSSLSKFVSVTAILLSISDETAARSTIPAQPPEMEGSTGASIINNDKLLDIRNEEYMNCTFSTDDPRLSGADGTLDYCYPGSRRITDEKPCHGYSSLNCCRCEPGFYHSKANRCSSCIPQQQCEEYESVGTSTSDAVCRTPPVTEEPPGLPPVDPSQEMTTPIGTVSTVEPSCPSTPCINNGSCLIDEDRHTSCLCLSGWTGRFCEEDIDECMLPHVCQNGGSCYNLEGWYGCNCTRGWEGTNCDVIAASDASPPYLVWGIGALCAFSLLLLVLLIMACIVICRLRHERVYNVLPSDLEQHEMQNMRGKNATAN